MKKEIFAFFMVLAIISNAQVGIDTTSPDASSILDITSENRGVLFPRMTKGQRDKIEKPAKGLMIYNTTSNTVDVNIGTPEEKNWQSLNFCAPEQELKASEVIVGNSESTLGKIGVPAFFEKGDPWSDYYPKKSWSAVIYDRNKFIGNVGNITKISYLIKSNKKERDCNPNTDNQKIYMKLVDYDYFMNKEYEDPEDLHNGYTKVFDGSVTWQRNMNGSQNWTEITLDKPFLYEANKYLVVFYKNDYVGDTYELVKCFREDMGDKILPVFISEEGNGKDVTKNKKYSGGEKTSTIYPVTKFNFN